MDSGDAALKTLTRAAAAGWTGGLSRQDIDGVVAAVAVLEDDPAFNAGLGSVLNEAGDVEVDAAVVDGASGRYGAVGAVCGVRHPARLALHVLRGGRASLLSGLGARKLADELGEAHSDLRTAEQLAVWRDGRAGGMASRFTGRPVAPSTETVGCLVASSTHVLAASSTGGVCGKPVGRIGDSALLGAGLWADGRVGVLCSGDGESMIALHLAQSVAAQFTSGSALSDAVAWGVTLAGNERGATCAVLAVTSDGDVAAAHNGESFPVVAHDGSRTWLVPSSRLERVPA